MRTQNLTVTKIIALVMALAMALMFLIGLGVTRVVATTPDLTSNQVEAVIEDAFAGLVSFDVQRVVNDFSDDAVLEDPAGTPPMVGKQAIADYLASFPTLFTQMKLYSLDIKVRGNEAAVKWRLRFSTKTGNVFFLEGIGFFRLNQQGKIELEREFFDLDYFLAQLKK